MTSHDDLLARADAHRLGWYTSADLKALVADLAAALRAERADRENADAALIAGFTDREIADELRRRGHTSDEVNRLRAALDRDRLADAMCRHSLIGDWYEKADLVLADLLDVPAADTATCGRCHQSIGVGHEGGVCRVPAADTATQDPDNSPEAMRARRPGTPCDCPTLHNVGTGWYCGVHGYQDVPAADTATQADDKRRMVDAVLWLWAELPATETRTLTEESPALADFCRHLHHSIEHEQAMVRRNVWAADVPAADTATQSDGCGHRCCLCNDRGCPACADAATEDDDA